MRLDRLKRWTIRGLAGLAALVLLSAGGAWAYLRASLPQLDGTVPAPSLGANVTITRDALGIPVIRAANSADLYYATGFLHAQERFFQMDLLRRSGAGELAELFGAKALPMDKQRRLHRFRARAAVTLAQMTPEERSMLERYAAGVNAGLGALGTAPFEYRLIGMAPRAWTPADSLLVVWAMFFDLQGSSEPRELARGWISDNSSAEQRDFLLPEATEWDAPLDSAAAATALAIPASAPAWWGKAAADNDKTRLALAAPDYSGMIGSNNWAVGGARTKDGAAIVSDDMHLGIRLPNTWYRLVAQFPDGQGGTRRVVGVTLPGSGPIVIVGSNGKVAWGFTNSYGDYFDLVQLDTDDGHPGQVRTPAGWETPASVVETILVKGEAAHKLEVRSIALGPIREAGGRHYALHWVAHLPGAINLNLARAATANTLDEVLAIGKSIGIPAQNLVAGDDRGNIGWTVGGQLVRRAQPGVASTYPLAGDSLAVGWDGLLDASQYPAIRNPAGGQLVTANSRQLMGEGAALIGDGGFDLGARTRQARDGVAALGKGVDVGRAYGVMLDDRALFMAAWRERALKVLDAAALDKQPARAEFQRLLKESWSGRASVDSVGYLLARNFMWALYGRLYGGANASFAVLDERATMAKATTRWPVVVGRLVDEQPAGWLPAGVADWRALQLEAIDKVIAEATRNGVALANASWGRRNTAAIEHPIGMAVPLLRPWLSAPPDMLAGDNHMPRVAGVAVGQSQRLTVTPGKEEQGVFNMPGGQSGHPMSPFFLSGHADWVSGKASPLLPGAAKYTLVLEK